MGRKDNQISLAGNRIELEEIEIALVRQPEVSDAAVVALPDQEYGKKIIAFLVTQKTSEKFFHEQLLKILPRYMVPSEFFFVEKLPRNSFGKVERYKLEEAYAPG